MTSFEPSTLFHLDDPETSRLAAINLDGSAVEQVMHAIVDLIHERGSLAAWELERLYGDLRGRRGWPVVAYYSVHRRTSELKKHVGVLVATGERVAPPNGKSAERLGLNHIDVLEAHARITRYMTKGKR